MYLYVYFFCHEFLRKLDFTDYYMKNGNHVNQDGGDMKLKIQTDKLQNYEQNIIHYFVFAIVFIKF